VDRGSEGTLKSSSDTGTSRGDHDEKRAV
jgi:hypothetical protein